MTISGTTVDAVSQAPLQGTFVALEQRDSQNIDRVQKVTTTDANGNFAFQSVSSGTYDVVAYSNPHGGTYYAWVVIFSVPANASLGAVPLQPQFPAPEGLPGSIGGSVTSSPVAVPVTAWLANSLTQNGNTVLVVIPFTGSGFAASGIGSLSYGFSTLIFIQNVGTFNGNGVTYTPPIGLGGLIVVAQAFQSSSSTNPDCVPPELHTASFSIPPVGVTTSIPTLTFTGCS